MFSRRSAPHEASTVSCTGDQEIWNTSSVCDSKVCRREPSERMSKSATVLSADPVARMNSLKGLKARQFTSAECASTLCEQASCGGRRVSHSISILSSPTLPKMCGCDPCHATSSTTPPWPL